MAFHRTAALRSSTNARLFTSHSFRSRASVQISRRVLFRNKQRGYSSSAESTQSVLKADLPWLITAVVVTIPSTIYCLQPRNPVKHDHEDHSEKHSDEESTTEENHDTPPPSSAEVSDGEEEDLQSRDTANASSQSQDNASPTESSEEGESTSGNKEESQDEKSSTENARKDWMKRREGPETAGGLPMGMRESKNEGETGSAQDKAAASKESLSQNQMSGKQAGLSNTPTKHSIDPTHHPNMSKKAEGAPETAKLQGTVKSNRPSSDNQEKFGEDKL